MVKEILMILKFNSEANLSHILYLQRLSVYGILAVALLLVACSNQSTELSVTPAEVESTPTEVPSQRGIGDTLRILNPSIPSLLNPHLSIAKKDWEVSRATYEPLASFDKDGQLIPFLAAKIPSEENGGLAPDLKSVTWNLRDDVKWSDGEPFTAADVAFTYEFITNPEVKAATASTYEDVASVEVIDPHTVKVNFKESNPAWALPFVAAQGVILPKHIFEPYNNTSARQAPANTLPVGTGPYHVLDPGIKPQEVIFLGTQLLETNKIVMEPNPYFRDPDRPYFSKVEFRGGGTPNEAARLVLQVAAENGGVDYAYDLGQLSPEELTKLETGETGQLVQNFGARVERVLLNRTNPNQRTADGERSNLEFEHPFLSDKKVRQAIAYAIDREALAELYGPAGAPTGNVLMGPPQFVSPNTYYEFDLEKAAAILDEAGWVDSNGDGWRDKDGTKLKVDFKAWTKSPQGVLKITRENLESIGIDVAADIVDAGVGWGPGADNPDSFFRFHSDMYEFPLRSVSPDPSDYLRFWTCGQIPQKANNWQGLNFERYCNPEYDALHQEAVNELDPEKRRQLFIQMNDMLVEDVVMIPVVFLADVSGINNSIEGVDLTPWDTNTWNIMDWRRIEQ